MAGHLGMAALLHSNPSPGLEVASQTALHSQPPALQAETQRVHLSQLQQQADLYRSSATVEGRMPTSIYSSGPSNSGESLASPTTGASMRGSSRFAKFFEQKTRDPQVYPPNSGVPYGQQPQAGVAEYTRVMNQTGGVPDNEAFQSMLAMLHNSSRVSGRASLIVSRQTNHFIAERSFVGDVSETNTAS
jgi:hypothetical protein